MTLNHLKFWAQFRVWQAMALANLATPAVLAGAQPPVDRFTIEVTADSIEAEVTGVVADLSMSLRGVKPLVSIARNNHGDVASLEIDVFNDDAFPCWSESHAWGVDGYKATMKGGRGLSQTKGSGKGGGKAGGTGKGPVMRGFGMCPCRHRPY